MSSKLIQVVTRNYEKLLTNPKFHDVIIKVGEEPNANFGDAITVLCYCFIKRLGET